jgi:hypothetical protein
MKITPLDSRVDAASLLAHYKRSLCKITGENSTSHSSRELQKFSVIYTNKFLKVECQCLKKKTACEHSSSDTRTAHGCNLSAAPLAQCVKMALKYTLIEGPQMHC